MADGVIDSLSIEIEASSSKAAQEVQNLANSLKELKSAQQSVKNGNSNTKTIIHTISSDSVQAMSKIELLRKKLNLLKSDLNQKMSLGKIDDKGIVNAALQIKNIQSQIDGTTKAELKNAVQSGQSAAGGGRSPVVNAALTGLKSVGSVLKTVLSTVGKIAKGIAKWAFRTVLNTVKKIAGWVGKIARGIADFAKAKIKNWWDNTAFAGIERTLGRINKIISSFGRIAFYRVIRSAIKYVTDQLKEGTENAYWYAKLFGDATHYIADAYDELASKNFKMSNQLGAAWATLIAKIQPILLQIISLVTKAAEVVTQFFAILSGKTTYLKAIDYTKAWAEEADKGSKSAKEWKNQLMGFDEINRLEAPSDSGRGSGNDDYTDYENMFEEAEIASNFLSELRDALDNGEWARVGQLFGERLNSLINGFDWKGWGKKLGDQIQKGIEISFNFLETADFKNLGGRIAEFLNSAGDQISFETLGRLSTRIKTALWDIVYGAVTNLNWKMLAINLSNYFLGAMQEWIDWLEGLDPAAVAQAIRDFFGNIKYGELKDKFVTLVSTAWSKAMELKDELFPDGLIATVTQHIKDLFADVDWEAVKGSIKTGFETAKQTAQEILDAIWPPEERESFMSNIKEKLQNLLQQAVSKIDFAAIHNILAYKLDEAVFGEKNAKRIWYNKGEFAGKELILGTEYGMEQEKAELDRSAKAYITDPLSQALYDMEHQAETSGANVSKEIKNATGDMSGSVNSAASNIKRDVWSMSSTFATETGKISRNSTSTATAIRNMNTDTSSAMSTMQNTVSSNSRGIISHFQSIISWAQNAWSWIQSVANSNASRIEADGSIYLQGFATGGFPEDGLFMANHGELVGQFSNGRTAVANNEQITEGIADAVYGAFMSAFSETGGNGGDDRPVNVYLDGRLIAKSNTRYQQQFARVNG